MMTWQDSLISKILMCVLVATGIGTSGNPSQPVLQTLGTSVRSTFFTRLAIRRCLQYTTRVPPITIFIGFGAAGMAPVLQGFSLWPNADNPAFTSWGHSADLGGIPQHVFVRVDRYDTSEATGVAYCSEARPDYEANNSVLFTVVVLGMGV